MVATAFIVRKTDNDMGPVVDGLRTVIFNTDDADNEATAIADCEAAMRAAGHDIPSPYFDSALQWDGVGSIDTDLDFIACGPVRVESLA